ncbi:nuclear transport factor 2 family protein [Sphingomonas sp. SUN019]|uniref:nuclear transport factor 2 family protein n=1 Tax=Sphingomonas sp. SUN019 TaxID=2937788 RepID=UPI0021649DAC|nr:nuclear transport factor 2 family protein [Sphingomonas sp. SUN019]UVO51038.1 nuclear transport factor 2 family protein [Sphingomonas sp. SUN019]
MIPNTPAGRLASRFGDVDAMAALYAPEIEWTISASLGVPRLIGREAVVAFNRQVWTEHHRPDCEVTVLDEAGDDAVSAVRFTYRAWSLFAGDWYENEYTLFVRCGADGIDQVTEAFDTAATIDFLSRRPIGTGWAALGGEVGDSVGTLGRAETDR